MSLTPETLSRLQNVRGEHLEGIEVVSITRADLDALIGAVDAVLALAETYELLASMAQSATEAEAKASVAEAIRATIHQHLGVTR